MKSQLFIPKEVKAGFQKRDDTYTKKLAYIIYKDEKGKLRKETSWRQWCHIPGAKKSKWSDEIVEKDKEVDLTPVDIENIPHDGFVLNKGVQRYGHWGNGRNMIRVYDDRGLEFEITTDNLMFILMTTNCHKRGLEGEFVYAWAGKELILLPTGCEEYKESAEFTGLQAKKVGRTDMTPGCAYTDKSQRKLVYLGRFNWYTKLGYWQSKKGGDIDMKKHHIFVEEGAKKDDYIITDGFTTLATKDTDTPVENYAELMEDFSKAKYASMPVGFVEQSVTPDWDKESDGSYYSNEFGSPFFIKENENVYKKVAIRYESRYNYRLHKQTEKGYYINDDYTYTIDGDNFTSDWSSRNRNDDDKRYEKEGLKSLIFCELFIKLESGRLVRIDQY